MRETEYKNNIFIITIPEGGTLSDAEIPGFDGFAKTGDINPKRQIRFYAKVIGFEDIRAPKRSWGYSLKDFNNYIKPAETINKLKKYLTKILK